MKSEYKKKHRNENHRYKEKSKIYQREHSKTLEGKEVIRRKNSKRQRNLDFVPLNALFKNSNAHHINNIYVIYIPEALHKQHYGHRLDRPETMININVAAFQFMNPNCYLHLLEDWTLKLI